MLKQRSWRIVAAESCSGGKLASVLTQCSGSSEWFEYSIVSYSNFAKRHYLGVSSKTLERDGPVSNICALQMVKGLIQDENFLGLAITGFAGPGGGSSSCPVGTVFIAWKIPGLEAYVERFNFLGERQEIVHQAIFYALRECVLKSLLQEDIYALKYFFAIGCDDLAIQCSAYQFALEQGFDINDLEPATNLHLTLVYLGNRSLSQIEQLAQIADDLSIYTSSFSVNFKQLNYWESSHSYVLEAAYSKNLEEVACNLSRSSDIQDKRPFKPHMTLSKNTKVIHESLKVKDVDLNWNVTHFSLYASFHGAFYIEQRRWNLKN